MPPTTERPRRRRRARRRRGDGRRRQRLRARHRQGADELPDQPRPAARVRRRCPTVPPIPQSPTDGLERGAPECRRTRFVLNGKQVSVDCPDDVRLLWVLRDLLGVTGPKYGCGLEVCKACTCHINGKAFNPCSVPVSRHQADGRDHDDRGPAGDVGQGPAPDAGGLARRRRRPVRLLPAGPDHGRGRAGRRTRKAPAARSPTPTSTRSATSAAAAPTRASARRSRPPRHRCSAAWRAAMAVDHLLYGLILSELRRRPRS